MKEGGQGLKDVIKAIASTVNISFGPRVTASAL